MSGDAQPSRVSPPQTFPGGIQLVGPLIRIPGRQLCACPEDIDELEQHIASCQSALAAIRAQFPEVDRARRRADPA